MQHLTETEFVDLIEGTLPRSRATHATTCQTCGAQVDALRSTLSALEDDGDDKPSPLLWNTLPSRVAAAIDAEPRRSWWMQWPVLVSLGCAAAVLLVLGITLWRPTIADEGSSAATVVTQSPQASGTLAPGLQQDDDPEQDAAWAVVRTAAVDLDYDAALAAGISASPGTAEAAAMELSAAERAELARLIEEEMKRTGL